MESKVLYHYCSLDTLISILKFKSIRLTEINKLNDILETKAVMEIARESVLTCLTNNIYGENIIFGMDRKSALKFISKMAIDQLLSKNDTLQYVFCLSEDGDLLSQWRGYGDNGRGVALGFNVECLQEIVSKSDDISFDKITYIDKDCSDMPYLNAIADTISQQILSAINQNRLDNVLFNPNGSGIFDRIERAEIFAKMAYFKNKTFEEEMEHRIVYNPNLEKKDFVDSLGSNPDDNLFPSGIKFKSNGSNLVSYLDLNLKEYCDYYIIDKIIIGPNCQANEDDILFMLQSYGFYNSAESLELEQSQSTYRI